MVRYMGDDPVVLESTLASQTGLKFDAAPCLRI